jgi:hypothetical protein
MSLIHALIARGTTVLAEHSQGSELKPGTSLVRPNDCQVNRSECPLTISRTDNYPFQDPAQ